MGHLWFHTFHLPLCVTVINILLTQNTRPQWFTWANYKYFHTSRTKCPCSFLSLSHSHILSHNLSPLFLTNSQKDFFFLFHPAGSQALPNPIPLSNFFPHPLSQTDIPQPPDALLTPSPFLPNPGSCTISQWNYSSLSVRTCWQEPCSIYIRKRGEREGGRDVERWKEKQRKKKAKTKSQQQFIWRSMLLIQEWWEMK